MRRASIQAAALAAAWVLAAACSGREKPQSNAAAATETPGLAPAAGAAARDSAATRDTAGGQAAAATVDMPRSYLFRPETLTVRAGTRVTWTNHDVFTHGVKLAQGGEQLTARPGQSVSHVFAAAGSYPYVCPFHPQMMKGVIRVEAAR